MKYLYTLMILVLGISIMSCSSREERIAKYKGNPQVQEEATVILKVTLDDIEHLTTSVINRKTFYVIRTSDSLRYSGYGTMVQDTVMFSTITSKERAL